MLEGGFLWAAVAAYVGGFLLELAGRVFDKPRASSAASIAALGGLALHAGAAGARWVASGHAPAQGVYENSLTGSLFLAALFAGLAWRLPSIRRALPVAIVAILLLLGNGVTAHEPAIPLQPPFRSGWLFVHVGFAWIAFGAYLISAIVAAVYLTRMRRDPGRAEQHGLLDDVTGRLIVLGFAADTVMIASGALWAHGLWGRYWGWDPIETWSLVSWLIYGANLHLRLTLGWRGPRAAWLAIASVLGVLFTFFGVQFVSDVHTELL